MDTSTRKTAARRTAGRGQDAKAAAPRQDRVFLFLQGPHGPFFHALGRMLREAGATVWRVGFNAGDRAFWVQPRSVWCDSKS